VHLLILVETKLIIIIKMRKAALKSLHGLKNVLS